MIKGRVHVLCNMLDCWCSSVIKVENYTCKLQFRTKTQFSTGLSLTISTITHTAKNYFEETKFQLLNLAIFFGTYSFGQEFWRGNPGVYQPLAETTSDQQFRTDLGRHSTVTSTTHVPKLEESAAF